IASSGLAATTNFEAALGGEVDLPMLDHTSGSVDLTAIAGSLHFDGATVTMPAPSTQSVISIPAVKPGLSLVLGSTGTFTGATFNIAAGDTVALGSGAYSGATFNVDQGASVDLTGGQTVTYTGTLTGSGPGTVSFSSGTINVGVGGVTLD